MLWWVWDGWAGKHGAVGDLMRCVHPASLGQRGGTFKTWCVWRLSGWLSAQVGRRGMEAGTGHSCVVRFDSHWGSAEILFFLVSSPVWAICAVLSGSLVTFLQWPPCTLALAGVSHCSSSWWEQHSDQRNQALQFVTTASSGCCCLHPCHSQLDLPVALSVCLPDLIFVFFIAASCHPSPPHFPMCENF